MKLFNNPDYSPIGMYLKTRPKAAQSLLFRSYVFATGRKVAMHLQQQDQVAFEYLVDKYVHAGSYGDALAARLDVHVVCEFLAAPVPDIVLDKDCYWASCNPVCESDEVLALLDEIQVRRPYSVRTAPWYFRAPYGVS